MTLRRSARSCAPLLAALGLTLLLAGPAAAVIEYAVDAPIPGTVISGASDFRAYVVAEPGERVEAVTLRLAGPQDRVVQLSHRAGPVTDGRSVWGAGVDPLGAPALPNGPYRADVRVIVSRDGQTQPPTAWQGHQISLAVPPPTVQVTAAPIEPAFAAVEVTWTAVQLPDFRRYVVERRGEEGGWSTVAQVASADTTRIIDAVPGPGTYRYRVRVARADGAGGELTSTSDPATVVAAPGGGVAPEPEPRVTAEPEADPQEGEDVAAADDPAGGEAGEPGPAETTTAATSPGVGRPRLVPGSVQPPQLNLPRGPVSAPQVVEPAPGSDVFEETLPFGSDQITVTDTDLALRDGSVREGGTLAVLSEEGVERRVYLAAAGGLLLLVLAGHLRRLLL